MTNFEPAFDIWRIRDKLHVEMLKLHTVDEINDLVTRTRRMLTGIIDSASCEDIIAGALERTKSALRTMKICSEIEALREKVSNDTLASRLEKLKS